MLMPFQRGAWLRVYGIPLHAWNEFFFKLCVFDHGRYLRTDPVSLNRERFDFARVLISTSSLDVVNFTKHILIDGVLLEIKIIEEWGFSLGEDACLFEEDDKSVDSGTECHDIPDGGELDKNVDILTDKIAKELAEAEVEEFTSEETNKIVNLETTEQNAEHASNVLLGLVTDSLQVVTQRM